MSSESSADYLALREMRTALSLVMCNVYIRTMGWAPRQAANFRWLLTADRRASQRKKTYGAACSVVPD